MIQYAVLFSFFAFIISSASISRAETVGQYLSQNGRYAQAFDFNLGFQASVPQGANQSANQSVNETESRLGARFGLSYEFDPLTLPHFLLPINLALLYSSRAVQIGDIRWTFSEVKLQILIHHSLKPGFTWVEPAIFLSPFYTTDLILSGSGGNLPATQSLRNRFSLDAGAALLVNISLIQARFYYAQNLMKQVESTPLTVSTFGADLLLPISRKRKSP